MIEIKLRKPYTYKGEQRSTINLDLENLTGADIVKAETELVAQGKIVVTGEYSKVYLSRIAARAAKVPAEVLETFDCRDFMRITNEVQAFLVASDSSDESDEPQEETQQTEPQPESSAE